MIPLIRGTVTVEEMEVGGENRSVMPHCPGMQACYNDALKRSALK